jgi:hypothetical protein
MGKALWRQVGEAVHTKLGDETVKALYGRTELYKHEQLRRVVWIPVSSTISPPRNVGGKVRTDENGHRVSNNSVYTFEYALEAHLFAADEEQTELLALDLLVASYERFQASAQPRSLVWQTEQEGSGGATKRQPKAVLTIVFRLPVLMQRSTRKIEGFTFTESLHLPTQPAE